MALEQFPDDWSRALCIVAHPDDLEYGAAGAIARWTAAGKAVAYLLVTRGEAGIDAMSPDEAGPLREAEERAGAAVVGVETVEFLDGHPDGVIEYGLPLRRDLARGDPPPPARPRRVDEPPGDLGRPQLQHGRPPPRRPRALDAARDAGNRWIFADAGEPWTGVRRVALGGSPAPTHYVDLGDAIELGIASLREHAAYIAGLGYDFDPDAFLRGFARTAGEQVGCEYAATFEVYEL